MDSAVGVGGVGVADGEGALGVTWCLVCVVVVCWRGCCWCWCWARPAFGWSAVPGVPLVAGRRGVGDGAGEGAAGGAVGDVEGEGAAGVALVDGGILTAGDLATPGGGTHGCRWPACWLPWCR